MRYKELELPLGLVTASWKTTYTASLTFTIMKVFAKLLSLVSLLVVAQVQAVQLSPAGSTVVLGSQPYFIPGTPVAQLKLGAHVKGLPAGELVPFTFVSASDKGKFTFGDLTATTQKFASSDDVWSSAFLSGAYLWLYQCPESLI